MPILRAIYFHKKIVLSLAVESWWGWSLNMLKKKERNHYIYRWIEWGFIDVAFAGQDDH